MKENLKRQAGEHQPRRAAGARRVTSRKPGRKPGDRVRREAATGRATRRSDSVLAGARDFWQLPDDELVQLLSLSRKADRVELKLTVPGPAQDATCAALGVDFARGCTQRVYYLDTDDRALQRDGLVVRVRSIKHRPGDSVIKLRPVSPGSIPAALRRSRQFVVDVDAMPGSYVCSGALKARLGRHDVERAMARRLPLRTLFSRPQLRLLAAHLPAKVGIDDLAVFGPVDARRRKLVPDGLDRPLLVEQWTFPDGSRILELSTRCPPDATVRVAARMAAVLRAYGVDLTGPQQTKTRATLDFFSARPASPTGGR
jgi:hypothetical protein